MDERQKEFMVQVFKAVPPTVGTLFGDFLTKALGITTLAGQGWEWLFRKNKETLEEYWREVDMYFAIEDAKKSAENIQFLREWITKIAFETREEKRKRLLNLAINYNKINIKFDEKLFYLNLLDRLSEEELIYFLKLYDHTLSKFTNSNEKNRLLATHGLLKLSDSKIQEAFGKIEKDLERIREIVSKQEDPKNLSSHYGYSPQYRHFADAPDLDMYSRTDLGRSFYNFIQREAKSKSKDENLPINAS